MQKISKELLDSLIEKATTSPRRRMNYNFHPSLDATYQRMLNCLMPDTYLRPHRHSNPEKSESFIILKGILLVLEFDNNGEIIDYIVLDTQVGNYGVDFLPNTWHSIIALTPCVVFESKNGPYCPINEKDFASWAPAEGSPEGIKYIISIKSKLGLTYE